MNKHDFFLSDFASVSGCCDEKWLLAEEQTFGKSQKAVARPEGSIKGINKLKL